MNNLWETQISPMAGEELIIANVMEEDNEVSLSGCDLLNLGLGVIISEKLPERPNSMFPDREDLKIPPMKIYKIIIPTGFKYEEAEGNPDYWRTLHNEKGHLIAHIFAKRGGYTQFKRPSEEEVKK